MFRCAWMLKPALGLPQKPPLKPADVDCTFVLGEVCINASAAATYPLPLIPAECSQQG